jgi:hypothetical protein
MFVNWWGDRSAGTNRYPFPLYDQEINEKAYFNSRGVSRCIFPASRAIATQEAKSSDSHSLVYVYRYKQVYGMAIRPSFYCDDKEIARLQNGRYMALDLKPGKHEFRSNDKQSVIDLDMKADQNYYIRLDLAPGVMKAHGRLTLMLPEQGASEFKLLKPVERKMVKDHALFAPGFVPE